MKIQIEWAGLGIDRQVRAREAETVILDSMVSGLGNDWLRVPFAVE